RIRDHASRGEVDDAAVAEHHVVAGPGSDTVRQHATNYVVVAVADVDRVDAARSGDGVRALELREHAGRPGRLAIVADYYVGPAESRDRVAARAREDDVVAGSDVDVLARAEADFGHGRIGYYARGAEVHDAVVAQHNVVPCAGRRVVHSDATN